MKDKRQRKGARHFPSERLTNIPVGHSKHWKIVSETLDKLKQGDEHTAIKIDLSGVRKKKAELRAALHRAAKREALALTTTSNQKHLYVFRREAKPRFRS